MAQQLRKVQGMVGFAFDGRRTTSACYVDKESTIVDSQGESVTRTVKCQGVQTEELVAMLAFPGAHFINFASLDENEHDAKSQVRRYMVIIRDTNSLETLKIIMCDSTNVVGTHFYYSFFLSCLIYDF